MQIFAQQPVVALVGLSPAAGDEATEVLVALQVLRQEDQLGPLFEADFAADDQLYLVLPRRLPGPYDTGQAAFVGDRQGPIARRAARAKSSVALEAPRWKLKLDRQCSSA